jgi:superfamily I DNA/RNA helicase
MSNLRLPFDADATPPVSPEVARDQEARAFAVDPRVNVALEASAGTGKTRVLVDRYVNLLRAGVEPRHILAMTFTRKAAAEMRDRILAAMAEAAGRGDLTPARWRELRDRMADISVSTIDAFCLSLLREYPLEADLDPGFSVADDAELPRLIGESLDRALRTCRALARDDEDVGLVFAQLGDRRVRLGLGSLLERRLVAPAALGRSVSRASPDWTVQRVADRGAASLAQLMASLPGGFDTFSVTGPRDRAFELLRLRLEGILSAEPGADPAAVHDAYLQARRYFLTQDGKPRLRLRNTKAEFACKEHWEHHKALVTDHAAGLVRAYTGYRRDLNLLVSRGVWRMYQVAEREYRATLDAHALLDFADLLHYTLRLLGQMEEFSQSRYRLESRYQHVLLDEFQDTSRPQWDLVALLIQSWGEGLGLAHHGPLEPSVFIVGDRKQSIYGFRDADVSVLSDAGRYLARLRQGNDVRRSITRSFRSVTPLLAFVNDVCADIEKAPERGDAFVYGSDDQFPVEDPPQAAGDAGLGLIVGNDAESCAASTAAEIARLLATQAAVRDRTSGLARAIRPNDVAILFRTRETHREFEDALETRGLRSYVYKGLGFFDADEIKDALAALWYLAEPASNLRAAAWLRSRFVRLSDEGLRILGPDMARALDHDDPRAASLSDTDRRRLLAARAASTRWVGLVDRVPPAELFDILLRESAYAYELRGPRLDQARENLKKLRALMRRIQNRGYLTLSRLVVHLDRRVGRRKPDDHPRGQGARVSRRVRREHVQGHRQPAPADARGARDRRRRGVGVGRRFPIRGRRRSAGKGAGGDQAALVCGADPRPRPVVPELAAQRRCRASIGRQPRGGAAPEPARVLRGRSQPARRGVARLQRVAAPSRRVSASGAPGVTVAGERRGRARGRRFAGRHSDRRPGSARRRHGPVERRDGGGVGNRGPRLAQGRGVGRPARHPGPQADPAPRREVPRGTGRRGGGGPAGRPGRRQRCPPGPSGRRGAGCRPLRARPRASADRRNPGRAGYLARGSVLDDRWRPRRARHDRLHRPHRARSGHRARVQDRPFPTVAPGPAARVSRGRRAPVS